VGWGQVLVGALPLVGVWLGVALGSRSQRALLQDAQRDSLMRASSAVLAEYLSAYRKFRRYVISEAPAVRLVSRTDTPGRVTEVIDGSRQYWDLVDSATANLSIHCRDSTVLRAAEDVRAAFWKVANARASHEIGDVPDEVVKSAKDAEDRYATAAAEYLDNFRRS